MNKILLIPVIVFNLVGNVYAQAEIVDNKTCSKLHKPKAPFMLVLKKGEEVIPAITKCLTQANIPAASFTALGALQNPIIAFFDIKSKQFIDKKYNGIYELISMQGNLTTVNNKPTVHAHVGLGDEEYNMMAGHLKSAIVGVTSEITVIPFQQPINRKYNEAIGTNLIMTKD